MSPDSAIRGVLDVWKRLGNSTGCVALSARTQLVRSDSQTIEARGLAAGPALPDCVGPDQVVRLRDLQSAAFDELLDRLQAGPPMDGAEGFAVARGRRGGESLAKCDTRVRRI